MMEQCIIQTIIQTFVMCLCSISVLIDNTSFLCPVYSSITVCTIMIYALITLVYITLVLYSITLVCAIVFCVQFMLQTGWGSCPRPFAVLLQKSDNCCDDRQGDGQAPRLQSRRLPRREVARRPGLADLLLCRCRCFRFSPWIHNTTLVLRTSIIHSPQVLHTSMS
jgi:hypothetical protein